MRHDDVHLATNEFGREPWEPFVLVLGESVFKGNGLAFDITEFTQATAEAPEQVRVEPFGRSGAEKPDPVHLLRWLRLGGERRGEEEGEGDDEPEASELHGESVGTREEPVKDTIGTQKATP